MARWPRPASTPGHWLALGASPRGFAYVVQRFAAECEAVGVVVAEVCEDVRVPHQVNLVGGDDGLLRRLSPTIKSQNLFVDSA